MIIAVGDILRFVAKYEVDGADEFDWVWHQSVTAGSTEADLVVLTALRDHLDLACVSIEPRMSSNVLSTEVELYVWDSVLNRFDGTAQLGWTTFVGTSGASPMMNQAALLAKFFTNIGRRQGRKFTGPFTESNIAGNAWDATVLANVLAWTAILDDALVTGSVTCTPCTFNVTPLSPLFETAELFNGVTAVDTVPSTMRSRKLTVGI